MARIPDDILAAILDATDIAELVGRTVILRPSGRAWSGLCPFHQEVMPSLHIWPARGTWKCFGCGKGGNAIRFVMDRDGLLLEEAVRLLAAEAGIVIAMEGAQQSEAHEGRTDRLREVTEWACQQFEAWLSAPSAEGARQYLQGRGIKAATVQKFRLGYAPPGWENLKKAAQGAGVSEADLLDAGLVAPGRRRLGCYDRFRGRVMFPIQDERGRVIAFGARTLADEDPKYLNSPETVLFTKGMHLYGLHLAASEIVGSAEVAVMEGYTDVILAHQAGFVTAVGGLGTSLTAQQAHRLSSGVKRLNLVYDGDEAGRRAAERAIPLFLPEPIATRVCVLPTGKDPADVLMEGGAEELRNYLGLSTDALDHLIGARRAAHDVSNVTGEAAALADCLEALRGVRAGARRTLFVKRIAQAFRIDDGDLMKRLDELQ